MKRCPRCDAPYSDDDVFCELDGARLSDPAHMPVSPAATSTPSLADAVAKVSTAVSCPGCGAAGSDDGDGYCGACGHRLADAPIVAILPPGATIGGRNVVRARAADDVIASGKDGEVAVALGDATLLAEEAAATFALEGHPAAPKVVEVGEDNRRGAFLVLALARGRPAAEVAPSVDLARALGVARGVVDLAEVLEKKGYAWLPRPTDFYLDAEGALVLSRVRAKKRTEGSRLDACCALAASGRALAPFPLVSATAALFRLLTGPTLDGPHPSRDAASVRAELEALLAAAERSASGPGHLAAECDQGLRREHNEDAVAVTSGETRGEPWTVMVVCDGVSCSTHAEQASSVAAKTTCDALAHFARSGDIAHEAATSAMGAAIRAAHVAICAAQIDHGTSEPPGTTIVAALVYRRRLTVGWVGDSRAYWIGRGGLGGELLTRDHSWVAEAVARGDMSEEEALRQPLAHALTRCLGPLENNGKPTTVEPDVRARDLPGAGYVVLCSDGLWNYFPNAADIAELVHAAGPDASSALVARRLVNHALHRGGGDNVSVAVYAHTGEGRG